MSKHCCDGCSTYFFTNEETNEEFYCDYAKYNDTGDCPCAKCLVKTMCEDVCYSMSDWSNEMREEKKGKE